MSVKIDRSRAALRRFCLDLIRRPLVVSLLCGLLLVSLPPANAASATMPPTLPAGQSELVRTTNDMLPLGVRRMMRWARPSRGEDRPLTLTVTLRRTHQAAFESYLNQLGNPGSAYYRRFLDMSQQAARFGPTRASYERVLNWLHQNGVKVVKGSANRLTITARASQPVVGHAFRTSIRSAMLQGRPVYANTEVPALPAGIASFVQSVSGLSDVVEPRPESGDVAIPEQHASIDTRRGDAQRLATVRALIPTMKSRLAGRLPGLGSDPHSKAQLEDLVSTVSRYLHGRAKRIRLNALDRQLYTFARSHSSPARHSLLLRRAANRLPTIGEPAGNFKIFPGWKSVPCGSQLFDIFTTDPEVGFALLLLIIIAPELFLLWTALSTILSTLPSAIVFGVCLGKYASSHGFGSGAGTGSKKSISKARQALDVLPQKIGLLEFDTYQQSDVTNWLRLLGVAPNLADSISEVNINGGVSRLGPGEGEVLLDIDTVLALALRPSGTKVVVYDAPPSTSFEAMFQAMSADGDTVISNSWSQCEDQTSLGEARAIDSVLASVEMKGISVFNGSGDDGTTCTDGTPDTVGVPADSPHATAVGGTTPKFGPAMTVVSEKWWDDPTETGEGGYGVSRYFARPAYQNGLSDLKDRSIPDVAVDADPRDGIEFCQADDGGCLDGHISGGTSMSAPEMAAMTAGLNQDLGKNLGNFNQAIYPLAGKANDFTTATQMKSNFQHVGLGAPNWDYLELAMRHISTGRVDPSRSIAGGTESLANGQTPAVVRVILRDSQGFPVAGKTVMLRATSGSAIASPARVVSGLQGDAIFRVTDRDPQVVKYTTTDVTDHITLAQHPTVTFVSPPATGGGIAATLLTVPADGTTFTTVTVTLKNAQGKPAINKTVSLSEGSGHAIVTGAGAIPGVTNAQGKASFTVVDLTAETVIVTAIDVTDGDLRVPGSAKVVFTNSGGGSNQCPAQTLTTAKGYSLSTYASGFFDGNLNSLVGCGGIGTPAWDSSGNLYVPDYITGDIYKLGPQGGSPGGATEITRTALGPYLGGVAFGKDGQLYALQYVTPAGSTVSCGCIYQLNPSNGAIERVVADNVKLTYMGVDPISGDIFASSSYNGGSDYDPDILRIHDTGPGRPPVDCSNPTAKANCSIYAAQGPLTAFSFDPNGTIYARGCYTCGLGAQLWSITGTNTKHPGQATLLDNSIPGAGVPIILTPARKDKLPVLAIGDTTGPTYQIDQLDLNHKPLQPVHLVAGGAGPLILGPDGCLYLADSNTISKLTTSKGSCPYTPASVTSAPGISLTQSRTSGDTGGDVTVTAHLGGIKKPSGTLVTFDVLGANSQAKLLSVGSNGNASFTYAGIQSGVDSVTATAAVDGKTVTSDTLFVRWKLGRHVTFTSLDLSPQQGDAGQRVKLTSSLTDITVSPAAPVVSQKLRISIGARHCQGVTNTYGLAACALMLPSSTSTTFLHATYAGSAKYLASSTTAYFSIVKPVIPPLNVTPTSLAFGDVAVGSVVKRRFTVANGGGSTLVITKSRPPTSSEFHAATRLTLGARLAPGKSVVETVEFTPHKIGASTATWTIGTATTIITVRFTATGLLTLTPAWHGAGTAKVSIGSARLTPLTGDRAGSVRAPISVTSGGLRARFTVHQFGGTGGDGTTLTLARPANKTFLGGSGGGLGYVGIDGVAICLDTHRNSDEPSSNFVGIADGGTRGRPRYIATTTSAPPLRGAPVQVVVSVIGKTVSVSLNGSTVLTKKVSDLPSLGALLFTAATGREDDIHVVSSVTIT